MKLDTLRWMASPSDGYAALGCWEAAWVAPEAGVRVAAGLLTVEPDGHALVDIQFASHGGVVALRASGTLDLDEAGVRWVGRLDDMLVAIAGTCRVDGRLLACFVDVDGEDWEIWCRRA